MWKIGAAWQALVRMIPYETIMDFFPSQKFDRLVMLTGQHLAAVRGALLQTFRVVQPYSAHTP